jgi:hypothetical protein
LSEDQASRTTVMGSCFARSSSPGPEDSELFSIVKHLLRSASSSHRDASTRLWHEFEARVALETFPSILLPLSMRYLATLNFPIKWRANPLEIGTGNPFLLPLEGRNTMEEEDYEEEMNVLVYLVFPIVLRRKHRHLSSLLTMRFGNVAMRTPVSLVPMMKAEKYINWAAPCEATIQSPCPRPRTLLCRARKPLLFPALPSRACPRRIVLLR